MRITPVGDRVVVKVAEPEQVTKSGIVLPDVADKERPEQGEVTAVTEGSEFSVGQVVLFTKYGPTKVKVDDQELLIVDSADVLAVVES